MSLDDGRSDIYLIGLNNGGVVSVNAMSPADGFQSLTVSTYTSLPATEPGAWSYKVADFNGDLRSDLYAINKNDDGYTSVTILDGESNFETELAEVALPLGETTAWNWQLDVADYNADGHADIYAINKDNPGGHTAVYIFDAADWFQSQIAAVNTPLGVANDPLWQFDVADFNGDDRADIYAIYLDSQGKTAVSILDAAQGFVNFSAYWVHTALGAVHDGNWQLDVGDYNGDRRGDIYGIYRNAEGMTKVNVLDAASEFQGFSAMWQPTTLGRTDNSVWQFAVSLQGTVAAGPSAPTVQAPRATPDGSWKLMDQAPLSGDMEIHKAYRDYGKKVTVSVNDGTTIVYGTYYLTSRGMANMSARTWKLQAGFDNWDIYMAEANLSLSARYGASDSSSLQAVIRSTGDVPIHGYSATKTINATEPSCRSYPVTLGVGVFGVSVGTELNGATLCDRGASMNLDSSTEASSKWTLDNAREIKAVVAYRVVVVPKGRKPTFEVKFKYPTDRCTKASRPTGFTRTVCTAFDDAEESRSFNMVTDGSRD